MRIFDKVDPRSIERREMHLWILALTVIFVLTLGQALMMYPAIFESPVILKGPELRNLFFAFCVLSFLMLGYFIDRQIVIQNLRKRLVQEDRRMQFLRQQASVDMMSALPGLDRFRDSLAMEFRRAFNARHPLSLVAVAIRPHAKMGEEPDAVVAYGDALKTLANKLRREDSLYQFVPGVFGIILPGVSAPVLQSITHRLSEGLHDASGVNSRFDFRIESTNYPSEVTSAREMEERVRAFLPEEIPSLGAETPQTQLTVAGN